MKKNIFKIVIASTILLACKDEMLTIDPAIPINSVDNFYKTEADGIAAINASYTPLSTIYNAFVDIGIKCCC
jgi:hypothetical protein